MNFSGNREAPERLSKAIRGLRGVVTRTGIELSLGLLLIYGEVRQTAVLCDFSAISF